MKINDLARRDSNPILRMDECTDSLGEATVSSILGANNGYWRVEIEEEDRYKTVFTFHHGIYRFVRIPFSLNNAPGTF